MNRMDFFQSLAPMVRFPCEEGIISGRYVLSLDFEQDELCHLGAVLSVEKEKQSAFHLQIIADSVGVQLLHTWDTQGVFDVVFSNGSVKTTEIRKTECFITRLKMLDTEGSLTKCSFVLYPGSFVNTV